MVGLVINEMIRATGATAHEVYYWATQQGAKLDLLLVRGTRRIGVEVKFTEKPAVTPSMRSALADLCLQELFVVHAGDECFPLAERVEAVPVTAIWIPMMKKILDRGVK